MVEPAEPALPIQVVVVILMAAAGEVGLAARLETAQLAEMVFLRLAIVAELVAAAAETVADLSAKTVQILQAAPGVIMPAEWAAARRQVVILTPGLRGAVQAEALRISIVLI
jgi:hypothetical protein